MQGKLQVQIKHAKNFSIKNFGPLTPPLKFFMLGLSPEFSKGKEAPNIKNLRGQGSLAGGGGLGQGFHAKFFVFMPFFDCLKVSEDSILISFYFPR